MKKHIVIACAAAVLLACVPATGRAQKSDIGGWYSLTVVKPFEKAQLSLRMEQRLNDGMKNNECRFAALIGGYRFNSWLLAETSYEFWDIAGGNYNHRAVGALTGTLKDGALTVSVREKYELNIPDNGARSSNTLRSRLRVQYSIPDCAVRPYLQAEVFTWDAWIRSLNYIGMDISVGQHSSFDVFYNYHIANGKIPVHTFGIGYALIL